MGEPVRSFGAGTAAPGKVLVVMSAARQLILANGKRVTTGHFLIEVSQPAQALLRAGYVLEVSVLWSGTAASRRRGAGELGGAWRAMRRGINRSCWSAGEGAAHPTESHARLSSPPFLGPQFATPTGEAPGLDPLSDQRMWFVSTHLSPFKCVLACKRRQGLAPRPTVSQSPARGAKVKGGGRQH